MQTITMNKKTLDKIIEMKVNNLLEKKITKKYLIDLFEDIALGKAIKEGDKGDFVNYNKFMEKLKNRINKK